MNTSPVPNTVQIKGAVVAIIVFIAFVLITGSFVVVDSGFVGVVRTLGRVHPVSIPEGFHLKKPFVDKVEQIDIRLKRTLTNTTSSSKDLQQVRTQVTIQYSIDGTLAPKTYQRIGVGGVVATTVIEPAIQESVKAIAAKYTAEQLITERAQVKLKIQEAIENFINVTLKEKDVPGALKIANVAITDFDFSEEFNKAIELKVKAEQEALQAKNEKLKRVTQAEAGAAERKLAAEVHAIEIELASKARADAIKREAEALKNNDELIALRAVEKWDGVVPTVNGGGTLPILNLDQFLNTKK